VGDGFQPSSSTVAIILYLGSIERKEEGGKRKEEGGKRKEEGVSTCAKASVDKKITSIKILAPLSSVALAEEEGATYHIPERELGVPRYNPFLI
jgi:hypothetical protein